MKKIFLFVVVFVSVLAAISYLKTHLATQPQNNQGPACDFSLWQHVYHGRYASAGDRLQVIDPCLTVTGTVMYARSEADGDWHIDLDLDPEYRYLLNQVSLARQQGYLVLETMCSNRVSQADTLDEGVCDGFSQEIFTPDFIGHRVAATGAYVIDRQHGWSELHPVTSIALIQ